MRLGMLAEVDGPSEELLDAAVSAGRETRSEIVDECARDPAEAKLIDWCKCSEIGLVRFDNEDAEGPGEQ